MKGWGTNEQEIIDILCHRSNQQRQQISKAFTREFGRVEEGSNQTARDLIEDLKSELGGNFESVIVALMLPTPDYCAKQLHKAVKGLGTNEDLLVEILCSRSREEVSAIALAYQAAYGNSLADDVRGDTSGPFQRLLVLAISGSRNERFFDGGKAVEQAAALYQAGEAKLGTDEDAFVEILSQAGQRQAHCIFEEYKKVSGHTIQQALKAEMSGELLNGLLAIVNTLTHRPCYFAERLQAAMKGWGTDDDALVRLIVSRCEIDLANIKAEYERMYSRTLYSDVKGETSGDYRKALLALIGDA